MTVLWAIALAVLTWPSFFRVDRTYLIAQLISFRGLVVVGLGALAVGFVLLAIIRPIRAWALSMLLVTLIAAIANGAILGIRGIGTAGLPAKSDESVRVLTWNTAGEATSAQVIAQAAVSAKADIVTLPETTIDTGADVAVEMRNLGQKMWAYHVEYGQNGWDASSTTILISPRLGNYSVIESSRDGSSNTSTVPSAVVMPVNGAGPTVVAVHAVAPRANAMLRWQNDLRWLADQCPGGNVIMAGDFNATLDHFSGLGLGGGDLGRCRDAAAMSGNGAVGTWSTAIPAWAAAPIDHVLVSDAWTVTGTQVLQDLDGSGSDHRPLVAQLEPAATTG